VKLVEGDGSVGERAGVDRNAQSHRRELGAAAPHRAGRRAMCQHRQVRRIMDGARVHDVEPRGIMPVAGCVQERRNPRVAHQRQKLIPLLGWSTMFHRSRIVPIPAEAKQGASTRRARTCARVVVETTTSHRDTLIGIVRVLALRGAGRP
jgi:hypothetical protein